jgi:hypothetical protein
MAKKLDYQLQRVCVNLRDGDWDELKKFHPRVGAGQIIREVIIKHVDRFHAKAAQRRTPIKDLDVDKLIEEIEG